MAKWLYSLSRIYFSIIHVGDRDSLFSMLAQLKQNKKESR